MSEPNSAEIALLRQEVRELTSQIRDLVDAWNTARGMVKFVKLLGSVSLSLAAIWGLFKLGSMK